MSTSGIGAYNQYLISGALGGESSTPTASGTPSKDNPFLGNTNWDCANLLKLINEAQKNQTSAEDESAASSTVTASMSAMVGC